MPTYQSGSSLNESLDDDYGILGGGEPKIGARIAPRPHPSGVYGLYLG